MTTEEILTKAARQECPECQGDGGFVERCGPTDVDTYQCNECSGTGLWLPELSEECHCRCHRQGRASLALSCCTHLETDLDKLIVGSRLDCFDDRDRLDAAAERLGCTYGDWAKDTEEYTFWYGSDVTTMCKAGGGDTILEAQQAALAQVIQHVWPEVEDV